MNKKTVALAGVTTFAVGVVGLAGAAGLSVVSAQDNLDDYPPIIQNLAEKFGVTPGEVEQVFEETRGEQRTARLDSFVDDGTITEDQKNLIIEKQDEHQTKINEIRDASMTAEERRVAIQELHQEMLSWADENDIPLETIGRGGFGMGKGMGGGMRRGGMGMMNEI